jgi:hypothetical protein
MMTLIIMITQLFLSQAQPNDASTLTMKHESTKS